MDDQPGIADYSPAKQYQDLLSRAYSEVTDNQIAESESIAKTHYEELRYSLGNTSLWEPTSFRLDARAKLARFSRVQFLELVTDVYDEMVRITGRKNGIASTQVFLPHRDDFNQHRNKRRQKLARLRPGSLRNLMSDFFYELGRRYPQFKEEQKPCELTYMSLIDRGFPIPNTSAVCLPSIRYSTCQNVLDDRVGELLRGPLVLYRGPTDVVSSSMSITEIITILQQHGCPNITDMIDVHKCSTSPIAGGGFGDVYRGYLKHGVEVAIKCPRLFIGEDGVDRMDLKMATRELYAWSKYRHPNIMPLLGVVLFRDRIAMVSPWMINGTLPQYLTRFPNANRFRICHQIASAVAYLHTMDTVQGPFTSVHGDLKGPNVLVSHEGTIKLIDFGNSRLSNSTLQFTGSQPASTFSTRWTAPELLLDTGPYSIEADVYALGMTMLEVFSGKLPFCEIGKDPAVITRVVIQKRHPERPFDSIPTPSWRGNAVWELLTRCWSYDPLNRPSAFQVQTQIERIITQGRLHNATLPDGFGQLRAETPEQALAERSEQ